jgi:superfamily II DNA or RNA helicase
MIGRGSRIHEDKNHFIVLDYGDNYKRHGLWDMDREWEKMWMTQKKRRNEEKLGVAPVKMCEKCQAIIAASALVCPFCAELQPREEKEKEQGELIEITEKYSQLIGRRISELSADELATLAKLKNKRGWCIRVARAKEQKERGFLEEFARAMNYKNGWVQHQEIGAEPIDFYDIILK